jgi:hypothetical protein
MGKLLELHGEASASADKGSKVVPGSGKMDVPVFDSV